jgi:hypothetical protein
VRVKSPRSVGRRSADERRSAYAAALPGVTWAPAGRQGREHGRARSNCVLCDSGYCITAAIRQRIQSMMIAGSFLGHRTPIPHVRCQEAQLQPPRTIFQRLRPSRALSGGGSTGNSGGAGDDAFIRRALQEAVDTLREAQVRLCMDPLRAARTWPPSDCGNQGQPRAVALGKRTSTALSLRPAGVHQHPDPRFHRSWQRSRRAASLCKAGLPTAHLQTAAAAAAAAAAEKPALVATTPRRRPKRWQPFLWSRG